MHTAVRRLAWCLALAVAGLLALPAWGEGVSQADWAGPDGLWQRVDLPDDWGLRGVPRPGTGRYRLQFQHAQPHAPLPWALWSARFPLHHRAWLNGVLVSDTWDVPDSLQPRTTAFSVPLPGALIRPGANEVVIEELGGPRSGLGRVWLGPAPEVAAQSRAYRRVWVDLTRLLNGLAGGAGLFALMLWARRRSEVTIGWFGVMTLILAVRNVAFVEPGAPSAPGGSLLMYLLVVTVTLLLGLFGASMGAPGVRRWPRWFFATSAVAAGAGLATGSDAAGLDGLRVVVYPLLTVNAVMAAGLLCRAATRLPRASAVMLAGSGLVIVASGLYDALLQSGRLPQHWEFLLPWTGPSLALGYAAVLGGRLVRALSESQRAGLVLEQRVRERTAELEAANTAKTRFLAAASHDLRQPLVTIGVLVGLLREQLSSPAQQQLAGRVDEAVAAMEGLVARLLDLSRLEGSGLRVAREPVALRGLLQAVAAHEREVAARQGLRLRLRVPAGARVLGDAVLIEQVLRNLVANALRYTEHGGVLVAVRRRGACWRIAVWDTGRGIPPEQQARVFDDFVQLDNPQRDRAQGLGLGLAIVRRAAALMGTEVTLRSMPGRGSCFAFELPAAPGAALLAEAAGTTAHDPPGAPALAGLCVVLVEDDEGVREALRLRLQAWGAVVLALASPAELAARIAADDLPPVDLVITDMRLPGGSGLDVVARVRAAQGAVPALVVTGNTAPDELAVLAASGLPVVHKPFRAEQLAQALRGLLGAAAVSPP